MQKYNEVLQAQLALTEIIRLVHGSHYSYHHVVVLLLKTLEENIGTCFLSPLAVGVLLLVVGGGVCITI